jgi:hypothetical protein
MILTAAQQEATFLQCNEMYEACKKQVAQMVEWKLTGLRDEAKIANIKEQAQAMNEKLADAYAEAVSKIYAI